MKRWLPLLALLPVATALAADWSSDVQATAEWNSNASNANVAADQVGALALRADASAGGRYSVTADDALLPSIHVGVERWPRFDELSFVAPGAQLAWQHKFGLGPQAPIVSASAGVDLLAAHDDDRKGTQWGATLAARRRWDEVTQGSLLAEFSETDRRAAVYDGRATQLSLVVDRDLAEAWRLTATAFWRTGDIVSYATPPRPDLVALAPNRQLVETFGTRMVAYSIDAHSIGGRVALTWVVNDGTSISLGYEYRHTERGSLGYGNQLVSASFVHQF